MITIPAPLSVRARLLGVVSDSRTVSTSLWQGFLESMYLQTGFRVASMIGPVLTEWGLGPETGTVDDRRSHLVGAKRLANLRQGAHVERR